MTIARKEIFGPVFAVLKWCDFLGKPFGGVKQPGLGREECLEELLASTQEKNIHIRFKPA